MKRSISWLLLFGFLAALGGYGILDQLTLAPNVTIDFLYTALFAGVLTTTSIVAFVRAMKLVYASDDPSITQAIFGWIGIFVAGCESVAVSVCFLVFALATFSHGIL